MTSDVSTVPTAQVHFDFKTGEMKRRVATKRSADAAKVPQRDQLNGGLYGMGTGVWCDSCSARGPAVNRQVGPTVSALASRYHRRRHWRARSEVRSVSSGNYRNLSARTAEIPMSALQQRAAPVGRTTLLSPVGHRPLTDRVNLARRLQVDRDHHTTTLVEFLLLSSFEHDGHCGRSALFPVR